MQDFSVESGISVQKMSYRLTQFLYLTTRLNIFNVAKIRIYKIRCRREKNRFWIRRMILSYRLKMRKEKECTLFDFWGVKTPVRTGCLTSCTWSPSSSSCRALYASLLLGSYFIGFFRLHVSHVYTGTIFNFVFVLSFAHATFIFLSIWIG